MAYVPIVFSDDHTGVIAPAIKLFDRTYGKGLADDKQAVFDLYYPSNVEYIQGVCEALYAALSAITDPDMLAAAQTLVAQIAYCCTSHAFGQLGQTDRGLRMMKAMRRDQGDTTVTQTPDDDPAVASKYLTPQPVQPVPPAQEPAP
jgi:hypothetical protein